MKTVRLMILLFVLFSVPFSSVTAQSCPSGKTLVFSDKRKACLDDYPVFRDAPIQVRGKEISFSRAYEDLGGFLSVAVSDCGAVGSAWVQTPAQPFPALRQSAIEKANNDAIQACAASLKQRSIDPRRPDCECTSLLNANSISNTQVVVERSREQFASIFQGGALPAPASATSDSPKGGEVVDRELRALAAERARLEAERQALEKYRQAKVKEDADREKERARLEAERQALEKSRQAKVKEDADREKERARLEADRQLLDKTRLAQIQETEKRTREIARLEAEAKVRDQKMRAEVQSRTTTVDERFQQSKPTGSVGSWAIYKSGVPFQQQQFCRITENFRQEIDDARGQKNQIKENVAFRTREQRLTALLPDGNFSNWIVRAVSVKQASDGSAAVLFELPCDVIIGSHACGQNVRSFIGTIPENSRLYVELATISVGDFLGVSGTFNFVDEKTTFQKGRSVASFRAMAADSHCEAKDVAKSGVDFFASSIQTLSNLK